METFPRRLNRVLRSRAYPADSVLTVRDKWPDEIFCPAFTTSLDVI